MDQFMTLQERIALETSESKMGQFFCVIVDKEEDNYYIGRIEFDSPEVDPEVLKEKDQELKTGEFFHIKITAAQPQPFDLYSNVL